MRPQQKLAPSPLMTSNCYETEWPVSVAPSLQAFSVAMCTHFVSTIMCQAFSCDDIVVAIREQIRERGFIRLINPNRPRTISECPCNRLTEFRNVLHFLAIGAVSTQAADTPTLGEHSQKYPWGIVSHHSWRQSERLVGDNLGGPQVDFLW